MTQTDPLHQTTVIGRVTEDEKKPCAQCGKPRDMPAFVLCRNCLDDKSESEWRADQLKANRRYVAGWGCAS